METINHECYVLLEVAKLLKEAGFDWKVRYMYRNNNPTLCICTEAPYRNIPKPNKCPMYWQYAAPSLEVAQRWLREVKGIYTTVFKDFATIDGWHYFVVKKEDWESGNESNFYQQESNNHTYEEAQEAGIKKALEMILEKGE